MVIFILTLFLLIFNLNSTQNIVHFLSILTIQTPNIENTSTTHRNTKKYFPTRANKKYFAHTVIQKNVFLTQ